MYHRNYLGVIFTKKRICDIALNTCYSKKPKILHKPIAFCVKYKQI